MLGVIIHYLWLFGWSRCYSTSSRVLIVSIIINHLPIGLLSHWTLNSRWTCRWSVMVTWFGFPATCPPCDWILFLTSIPLLLFKTSNSLFDIHIPITHNLIHMFSKSRFTFLVLSLLQHLINFLFYLFFPLVLNWSILTFIEWIEP